MTNLERMKMLALAVKDMNDAVQAYEKAKAGNGGYARAGYEVPMHYSKEAIKRRITQIRQDLLVLGKEL